MEYLASVVGLSGAGKTTAISAARVLLANEGISSASFHDRTSDPESTKIDSFIHSADLSPEARMHLIIAARRQIIDRRIVPSMQRNDVTLTDRYYPCTIAYQAYGERLDLDTVARAALLGAHDALPNRIFLLDVSASVAKERMRIRGDSHQIFDAEPNAFHERVRRGYLAQADANESFTVLDGTAPKMVVARAITNRILRDLTDRPA
jgi:dTMP kinase